MSESILIDKNISKEEKYKQLIPQVEGLLSGEKDIIANMANVSAALKETFDFWWVGFYLVKENQLVLGPFQGPIACTRIPFTKGVCGACFTKKETIIVPNVDEFPGHIACSSATKSEIVLPVFSGGEITAVLDVDSEHLNSFDEIDKMYLEKIIQLI